MYAMIAYIFVFAIMILGITLLSIHLDTGSTIPQGDIRGFDEPIDVVYLWVDGTDEAWHARKNLATGNFSGGGNSHTRFQNNGELEYSVRSVLENVEFAGHIYIVTQKQTPPWYDHNVMSNRITIVDHSVILPQGTQTFNSNVIEYYLHRIPNVSSLFMVMYDDYIITRTMTREDIFYEVGKPRFGGESSGLSANMKATFRRTYLNMANAYSERVMRKRVRGVRRYRCVSHFPIVINSNVYEEMHKLFADEIERTTRENLVRRSNDFILMCHTYPNYMHHEGKGHIGPMGESFVGIKGAWHTRKSLQNIAKRRPIMACINDHGMWTQERCDLIHQELGQMFPRRIEEYMEANLEEENAIKVAA
tara:strand:+ start:639 stop:1727 length:1089 start_codon:yes stop_codon:yes gene_type:complete